MLGGWSERMEERLLWLLRLGRGLAEGRSERMRGCASCGHGGRRPGWGRAWGREGHGDEGAPPVAMVDGGGETGREHGWTGKF